MLTKDDLLTMADLFRSLTGIEEETTLSHRIFGDTKKLRQLRDGSGITLERFNAAMRWLALRWPDDAALPDLLVPFRDAVAPAVEASDPEPKEAA